MNSADRTRERLVGVALAGALALNFPLLYLFSGPALYLYLFAVWGALILLVALIIHQRHRRPDRSDRNDGGRPRA